MATMKQGINTPLVAVVGLIAGLLFVIVILGVQGWYAWQTDKIRAATYEGARDRDLARITAEQTENLKRVGYTSDARDAVALPIDAAMARWLEANGQPGTEGTEPAEGEPDAPDAAAGTADPVDPVTPAED